MTSTHHGAPRPSSPAVAPTFAQPVAPADGRSFAQIVAPTVGPAAPAAMPAKARDLPPHEYQQRLAVERPKAWRGIVALLLLVIGVLVFSGIGGVAAVTIDLITGRMDPMDPSPAMTPALLAGTMAGLAMLTPWSMLLQKWFFKVPMRSLHSLREVFRWRLLARTALIVVPVWILLQAATPLMASVPTTDHPLVDVLALLAITVFLTPLQSAGEEYAFRGLAFRIAASWGLGPRSGLVIGIVVSSVLFMLAHAALDPWLNLYYFVFGATLAVIAWRTGGLEIPVLIHATNNVFAFLMGILISQDLAAGFDRSAGAANAVMLIPCVTMIAVATVIWWRTRGGAARTDRLAER